jgi:DNA-binding NarL/FixJ family response regulator
MSVRILIADDHEVVRSGLRGILEGQPGWEVCAEAADGRQAVQLAGEMKPDVAVLDLSMPALNGLDATRQISQVSPKTEVLIFTMHDTEALMSETFAAGAHGFLNKADAARLLVGAVQALSQHQLFFTEKASRKLVGLIASGKPPKPEQSSVLSAREREIVSLVAEGKSNKEIAATLNISVKTVETHRSNLMRKLRITSIAELVRYAVRNHLVVV